MGQPGNASFLDPLRFRELLRLTLLPLLLAGKKALLVRVLEAAVVQIVDEPPPPPVSLDPPPAVLGVACEVRRHRVRPLELLQGRDRLFEANSGLTRDADRADRKSVV